MRSLVVFALVALPATAQTEMRVGKPADVGMSAEILQAGAHLFRDAVATDDLRGAVILVAHRGVIVLHEAYGWADVEAKRPMRKDALFRMASNTKPVVAAAVLKLAEDGKLSVGDFVRRHLPSFDNHRAGRMTVAQLLTHTSGFRIPTLFLRPLLAPSPEHPDAPTLRLEADRFGAVGAAVEPGTSYRYSNPGYNTLGALVETLSGEDLESFLRRRFYDPLGMRDTTHHESRADHERMSVVYRKRGGRWRRGWSPGDPPDYPFVRASGGMISTAHDYARFGQMMLDGGVFGTKRILSEASVRAATHPHTAEVYPAEERARRDGFYGFGWRVERSGVFSHGGSDGTFAWIDPNTEVVGVVLTQSPGGKNPRAQFMRVVNAAIPD